MRLPHKEWLHHLCCYTTTTLQQVESQADAKADNLLPKLAPISNDHIFYMCLQYEVFLAGVDPFLHTHIFAAVTWMTHNFSSSYFYHICSAHKNVNIFATLSDKANSSKSSNSLSILRHEEFVHLDQIPINSHNVVSVLNFVFATPFGARGRPAQRNLLLRSETLLRMELRQVLRMCRVSIIY